jgi:hypothetical protein
MEYMMLTLILWFLMLGPAPEAPAAVTAPPRELCQLRGSVYVTDREEEAHFRVYVEEYETSAHLVVFSEENRLFADQPGLWHFTDKPAFADFRIFLTDTRAFSDFSIAYTDVASFAGCR